MEIKDQPKNNPLAKRAIVFVDGNNLYGSMLFLVETPGSPKISTL